MKLIFCIDKKNGMLFAGKRQSRDSVLYEEILKKIDKRCLWMSSYSAPLFPSKENIFTDDDYSSKANDDDYCFIEDKGYAIDNCQTIILYKWNRLYPSDTTFNIDLKSNGFKLTSKRDFKGSSHEKITEEVYEREQVK